MSADRLEIECHDGYIIVDGCEYHDHGDFVLGLVTAIRQQAGDIAELRAKTESSMSFKLWLEDMDENGDPIEWAIHGTSQDIGRMQARLGYLNDAVTEREQLRADLAAAVAARDWQIQATKAAIESCNQATTAGLAAVAERAAMFTAEDAEDFYFQGFDACYSADEMGDMDWRGFWLRSKAFKLIQERTK